MGMSGRGWTEQTKAQAQALFASGKSYQQIGEEMGRTRKSVQTMFARLRDGGGCREIKPWSENDIATLKELRAQRRKPKEIAAVLRRDPDNVRSKIYYLEQLYIAPRQNVSSVTIPPKTMALWRERQNLSRRTLTASLMGDPLPGFSALERRT
jgi:hypothetical protein